MGSGERNPQEQNGDCHEQHTQQRFGRDPDIDSDRRVSPCGLWLGFHRERDFGLLNERPFSKRRIPTFTTHLMEIDMNTQSNSITAISTLIAGAVLSLYGLAFIANVVLGH